MVERVPVKHLVVGSSPTRSANLPPKTMRFKGKHPTRIFVKTDLNFIEHQSTCELSFIICLTSFYPTVTKSMSLRMVFGMWVLHLGATEACGGSDVPLKDTKVSRTNYCLKCC